MHGGRDLAKIFAAARGNASLSDDAEGALPRMLAEGRAAWPDLVVPAEAYVRYVAERAPSGPASRLSDLHAADLYLACACAAGDDKAIAALERHHLGDLVSVLARCGVEYTIADEAVQAIRRRLFVADDGKRTKIAEYGGRGPLGGWLHVAATRTAQNLRRDEATRAAVHEAVPPASLPAIDPELSVIQRRYGNTFSSAFRDAFDALTPEERSVMRLFFVDGLNLDRIGDALGLSRATVGRRMIRARERLLEETLRLLGDRLRATPTELESLLAVVRSKLEISLAALLEPLRAPVSIR